VRKPPHREELAESLASALGESPRLGGGQRAPTMIRLGAVVKRFHSKRRSSQLGRRVGVGHHPCRIHKTPHPWRRLLEFPYLRPVLPSAPSSVRRSGHVGVPLRARWCFLEEISGGGVVEAIAARVCHASTTRAAMTGQVRSGQVTRPAAWQAGPAGAAGSQRLQPHTSSNKRPDLRDMYT
jgi:hypothetical protein